jgi:hypothetical protein
MSNILSYTSLILVSMKINSRFSGSSKYRVIDDELVLTQDLKKKTQIRLPKSVKPNYDFCKPEEVTDDLNKENDAIVSTEQQKPIYRLNKRKIKKKCFALSRLEKSKKFLAFYSISFPVGLSDDNCYKVFNIWLTRCRKDGGLNSYLWVAERQKNKTIHFHLLTNDHMLIRIVNGFMAIALSTVKRKGVEALQCVNPDKYNGIDVKRVKGSRKSLLSYLVKYISKNEIEFYRLPWHCSRDVSRLFTSMNFEDEDDDKVYDHLPEDPEQYHTTYDTYFTIQGFKFTPEEIIFNELDGVNEIVYNTNN